MVDFPIFDSQAKRKSASIQVRNLVRKINAGEDVASSRDELLKIAQGNYDFGAIYAVVGIGDIGCNAYPIIDKIGDLLLSSDPYVAREAAYSISRLGAVARSQLPNLLIVMKDPNAELWPVLSAIDNMGIDALESLPQLRERLPFIGGRERKKLMALIDKLEKHATID